MIVTTVEAFIEVAGRRRGRVCQRQDGRFHFITETLVSETDESLAYWKNEYPPSGLYERLDDAATALVKALGKAERVGNFKATAFELNVGPYPDLT